MKNFLKKGSFLAVLLTFCMAAYAQAPFITTWNVTLTQSGTYEITIPTHPGNQYGYSYDVHWGDGNIDQNVTGDITHDYANTGGAGQYQVEIYGEFPAIFFNDEGDKNKIISIDQWGDIPWQTFQFAFAGCSNLAYNAPDQPNLSEVIDISYMFYKASSFSGDLNSWDVSPVKFMRGTFSETKEFSGPIDSWNVSNVYDITSMFEGAQAFNDNIADWPFEVLEEMTYAFARTSNFDQPIGNWNVSNVTDMSGVFANALVFNQPLEWETEQVEIMHNMFSGAIKYNQHIGFNTSNVRDMSHMFQATPSFDQNLGVLDISNVTDMRYMLSASNLSVCNYELTLNGWTASANSNVTLGADRMFYYDNSGRNSLVTGNGWTILGDNQHKVDVCGLASNTCHVGSSTFFKTSWTVTSGSPTVTIPANTTSWTYSYDVDWESDGIFDDFNQTGAITHTYSNPGTYQVSIRGNYPAIIFNSLSSTDKDKLSSIDQWGCIEWQSLSGAFYGCHNVTYNATDAPDLNSVTSLAYMFRETYSFNGNLNNWDVSNITSMREMFNDASSFNGNITGWSTANVTDMSYMFRNANNFNQNIGSWNVGSVINMRNMFAGAGSFHQNLNSWNVSNVTNMTSMFYEANAFNGAVSNWDVSSVTDMSNMFSSASSFNRDLNAWNMSNVTDISYMFSNATSFNNGDPGNNSANPLNNWDVSNVNTLFATFNHAHSFNQDISNWNISNVTDMGSTFSNAFVFDQDINGWDVTNVTNMSGTFHNCYVFNQQLDNWNVGNATNMSSMFGGAHVFNQDISGWDVSNVTNMFGMFNNAYDFDQDISGWDVANVNNMGWMFSSAGSFNHDLSAWDVSSVTNMNLMFRQAYDFDQDISSWDVSNVSNMEQMFYYAASFNQNLGAWDLSSASNLINMFSYSGMRLLAYDGTITGWSNSSNAGLGLALGAQNVYYCDIASNGALTNMTSNGWTFNGHIFDCSAPLRTKPSNSNPVNQLPTGNFTVNNSRNSLTVIPPALNNTPGNSNPVHVHLYNISGKIIYQGTQPYGNVIIPTGSFSSGVYILTINSGAIAESKKVTIH